jgi:hypothetical protein
MKMSVTLSGQVTVEAQLDAIPTYTITITASTSTGTTLGTTKVEASAASPASYSIPNLPPGQCFVNFTADQLTEISEIILLGVSASNVIDVQMSVPEDSDTSAADTRMPVNITGKGQMTVGGN